jgi:head-tail adaptor
MNPGKLNKKIEIQRLEKTMDSEGIEEKNWISVRNIFAAIEDKIVRTTNDDNSIVTQVETNMIIRKNYKSLCTSNIRLVYENRVYTVLDMSEVDENYIKLITKGEKLFGSST